MAELSLRFFNYRHFCMGLLMQSKKTENLRVNLEKIFCLGFFLNVMFATIAHKKSCRENRFINLSSGHQYFSYNTKTSANLRVGKLKLFWWKKLHRAQTLRRLTLIFTSCWVSQEFQTIPRQKLIGKKLFVKFTTVITCFLGFIIHYETNYSGNFDRTCILEILEAYEKFRFKF